MDEIAREKGVDARDIEIWFADEARVGQKNKITRRWAQARLAPRAPNDQRTASTYIFGAICPKDGKGAALVLPRCDTDAMNLHLAEIATKVAPGGARRAPARSGRLAPVEPAHRAAQHHPPRAAGQMPGTQPGENIWQFMRDNWLSNRVFKSYDDIVDHCRDAWNKLVDQPWRIMSIGMRDWAHRS